MSGLAKWAEWCYSRPSKLFFNGLEIQSQVSVQQEDPIGPLLFALALQPIILRLSNIQGLELAFSYLDDLVLAGEDKAVAQGISMLQTLASPIGLKLNEKKCELIPAAKGGNGIDWRLFDSSIPKKSGRWFQITRGTYKRG